MKKARIRIAETHELSTAAFTDVFPIFKTIRELFTFERSTGAQVAGDQEKGLVPPARKKKKRVERDSLNGFV